VNFLKKKKKLKYKFLNKIYDFFKKNKQTNKSNLWFLSRKNMRHHKWYGGKSFKWSSKKIMRLSRYRYVQSDIWQRRSMVYSSNEFVLAASVDGCRALLVHNLVYILESFIIATRQPGQHSFWTTEIVLTAKNFISK